MTGPTVSLKMQPGRKNMRLTPSQRKAWGQTKKVCHHGWWERQRCQGDQSLGFQSLTVGPAEINEVWGLSQAGSPKEPIHHRLKVSCSLETRRWDFGSETEIEEGQQNCEQHEGTSRTSAAFNASLYLAITALRASPDEKTMEQKKKGYLKAGTFYLRRNGNQS